MIHIQEQQEIFYESQKIQDQTQKCQQQAQNQQSGDRPRRQKVGNFIIDFNELLGQGSFSKVYRGVDSTNNQFQVAIKVIHKEMLNSDLKFLVQSQIKILRLINHENIVKCYEIVEDHTNIYIVMQICSGGDIQSRIDKNGPISEIQAIPIIKGVFKGLTYLSQMSIIHRDIKVANIFLHNNFPKIADFGFAIHNKSKKEFQDISIGSPIYMSPQGIKHNVYGPKTDVWAFGIFIYQLVHGKTPYHHCTKQKELKYNISNALNWNALKADLSYSLKQIILKCLQVNYQKRTTLQKLKQFELFKEQKPKEKFKHIKPNTKQKTKTLQLAEHTRFFNKQQSEVYQQIILNQQKALNIFTLRESKQTPRTRQDVLSLPKKKGLNHTNQPNLGPIEVHHLEAKTPKTDKSYFLLEQYNNYFYKLQKDAQGRVRTQNSELQREGSLSKNKQFYRETSSNKYYTKKAQQPYMKDQHRKPNQFCFIEENNQIYQKSNQRYLVTKRNNHNDQHGKNELCFKKYNNFDTIYGHQKTKLKKFNSPRRQTAKIKGRQNLYEESGDRLIQINSFRSDSGNTDLQNQNRTKKIPTQTAKYRNVSFNNQQNSTRLHIDFPQYNIDCYLYLIHFSRLIYKVCCNLQEKPKIKQTKTELSTFCSEILLFLRQKIQLTLRNHKHTKLKANKSSQDMQSLIMIQQTVQKYINQCEHQLLAVVGFHGKKLNFSNIILNLDRQLNIILSEEIRSSGQIEFSKQNNILRLLYLGSVFIYQFKKVLNKHFVMQSSKYWFEFNLKNAIKDIQNDIEGSNAAITLQSYLKFKRKLIERSE